MGAQGSKAGGQMTAAAVQARRAALAEATQAEARAAAAAAATSPAAPASAAAAAASPSEGAAAGEGAVPSMAPAPLAPTPATPAAVPGGSALLETDAALIKAMNELGPAIKTLRLETPRKAQNKMVQAHDERAHTVTEETLAKILKGRRDAPQGFSLPLACEKHGLKPEELAQALKVLEVPRVVERQGQKFGYWN